MVLEKVKRGGGMEGHCETGGGLWASGLHGLLAAGVSFVRAGHLHLSWELGHGNKE